MTTEQTPTPKPAHKPFAVQMQILGDWEIATECSTFLRAHHTASKLRKWCGRPIRVVSTWVAPPVAS